MNEKQVECTQILIRSPFSGCFLGFNNDNSGRFAF